MRLARHDLIRNESLKVNLRNVLVQLYPVYVGNVTAEMLLANAY